MVLCSQFFYIFPITSMPDEADDGVEKPFPAEKLQESGEHQEPSEAAKKALGLSDNDKSTANTDAEEEGSDSVKKEEAPKTDAEKQSDEKGKKLVDNYSAKIQEKSEELYATDERLALRDSKYLDKLLSSNDKIDKRNAEKILQRNASTFGASTPEDYKLQKAKREAGDDPMKQKIAEVDFKVDQLEKKERSAQWKEWKLEHSVKGDIADIADDIYSKYPDMEWVDVLDTAKGRLGIRTSKVPSKSEGSVAIGGGNTSQSEQISPQMKKLLRIQPESEKFAKEYLGY